MATHRSVLLDHQSIVDGVSVREKKDLTITINDETKHFLRTRSLQVQGEFVYMFSALTGRTKCKQTRLALATCKDGQNAWMKLEWRNIT
jgi:hypothetical protein